MSRHSFFAVDRSLRMPVTHWVKVEMAVKYSRNSDALKFSRIAM